MAQLNPLKTFTHLTLGERVDRAADNITTGEELFLVKGGRVIVNLILGEVTTVIESKAVTFRLSANPTVGTITHLTGATGDLNAAEQGTLLTVTGTITDDIQKGSSGSIKAQLASLVVAVGAIEATVGDTHTGAIKWSLWYTPLDDGAYVEAA